MIVALKIHNISPADFKGLTALEWYNIQNVYPAITGMIERHNERKMEQEKMQNAMNIEMNKRFNR